MLYWLHFCGDSFFVHPRHLSWDSLATAPQSQWLWRLESSDTSSSSARLEIYCPIRNFFGGQGQANGSILRRSLQLPSPPCPDTSAEIWKGRGTSAFMQNSNSCPVLKTGMAWNVFHTLLFLIDQFEKIKQSQISKHYNPNVWSKNKQEE